MPQFEQQILVVRVNDVEDCVWFDDWGDGPFTRAQVEHFCERDLKRESEFFRYPQRICFRDWKKLAGAA